MGRNLAKTPLVAVFYAAAMHFIAVFIPLSPEYASALELFVMPITGYLILMGYSLFICVTAALVFGEADSGGVRLLLSVLPAFLGLQWVMPLLTQILFGDLAGVMSQGDTLMRLAQGCAGTVLALVLCLLLFARRNVAKPNEKAQEKAEKRKLRAVPLMIRLLILPFIFLIMFVLTWYFLGWSNDYVRAYYGGVSDQGFVAELINMLLTNVRLIPLALARGLLYALFGLPLMLRLSNKRGMFVAIYAMLCVSGALLLLIPNPVIGDEARMGMLLEQGVLTLSYSVVAGLFLHTAFAKGIAHARAPARSSAEKADDAAPKDAKGGTPEPPQPPAPKTPAKR